jgi:hypothetical protein
MRFLLVLGRLMLAVDIKKKRAVPLAAVQPFLTMLGYVEDGRSRSRGLAVALRPVARFQELVEVR